jgi:hypothetical protein
VVYLRYVQRRTQVARLRALLAQVDGEGVKHALAVVFGIVALFIMYWFSGAFGVI